MNNPRPVHEIDSELEALDIAAIKICKILALVFLLVIAVFISGMHYLASDTNLSKKICPKLELWAKS